MALPYAREGGIKVYFWLAYSKVFGWKREDQKETDSSNQMFTQKSKSRIAKVFSGPFLGT